MLKKMMIVLICGLVSVGLISCGNAENAKTEIPTETKEEIAQVLVDDEYVKITYVGLDDSDEEISALKLSMENKSDDTYTVYAENVSGDDRMAATFFSEKIAPGETVDGKLGLEDIEKGFSIVEGSFALMDDNYDTLKEEPFKVIVNEAGADSAQAKEAETELGTVVLDNEYAKITYLGFAEESNMGPTLKLTVENKTDKTIMILSDDFYADGNGVDSLLSCNRITSGKKATGELTLYADEEFKTVKGSIILEDEERNSIAKQEVEFEVQ